MFAKVSKKGQITLPAEVRKRLNIELGTYVRFIIEGGNAWIVPAGKGIETLQGSVNVSGPQDFKAVRQQAMEENVRERNARN
ncbi:MAG: AbrB/MazE/SpoVT family DNA-binding domain-containing protein [Armatimonadetes bacterium]|nr:AbrB/MazE/SpoVT family DNA-binding domain-containing protein [Armatimonadota bacterium]